MDNELNIKQIKKDSIALALFSGIYLILSVIALIQLVSNDIDDNAILSVMIAAYSIMAILIFIFGSLTFLSFRRFMSHKLLREKAIKNRDERLSLIRQESNTMTLIVLGLVIVALLLIAVFVNYVMLAGVCFLLLGTLLIVRFSVEVYYKRKY